MDAKRRSLSTFKKHSLAPPEKAVQFSTSIPNEILQLLHIAG
jgi:hypothetical protein